MNPTKPTRCSIREAFVILSGIASVLFLLYGLIYLELR
jgi:hypothetical protein